MDGCEVAGKLIEYELNWALQCDGSEGQSPIVKLYLDAALWYWLARKAAEDELVRERRKWMEFNRCVRKMKKAWDNQPDDCLSA